MDAPFPTEPIRKTRGDAVPLREYERDLEKWLVIEGLTYAATSARMLEVHGVKVSPKVLWRWLKKHNAQRLRQTILANITSAAQATRQLRDHAARHGLPEVGELMGLLRVIAANVATRPDAAVNADTIVSLLRPVIEHMKLQQGARKLELEQGRLELLQRRAALAEAAEKTLHDTQLDDAAKMAEFARIFGLPTAPPPPQPAPAAA